MSYAADLMAAGGNLEKSLFLWAYISKLLALFFENYNCFVDWAVDDTCALHAHSL